MTKTRLIALTSAIAVLAGCELDFVDKVRTGTGAAVHGLLAYNGTAYAFTQSTIADLANVGGSDTRYVYLHTAGSLGSNFGLYDSYPGSTSAVCGMAADIYGRVAVAERAGDSTRLRLRDFSGEWSEAYVFGAECLGFNGKSADSASSMLLVSPDGVRHVGWSGSVFEHEEVSLPSDVYRAHARDWQGSTILAAASSHYYGGSLSYGYTLYEVTAGQIVNGQLSWGTPEAFSRMPTRFAEKGGTLWIGDAYGDVYEYSVH